MPILGAMSVRRPGEAPENPKVHREIPPPPIGGRALAMDGDLIGRRMFARPLIGRRVHFRPRIRLPRHGLWHGHRRRRHDIRRGISAAGRGVHALRWIRLQPAGAGRGARRRTVHRGGSAAAAQTTIFATRARRQRHSRQNQKPLHDSMLQHDIQNPQTETPWGQATLHRAGRSATRRC